MVALVVLVTLISLAIWVAYAIPGQTPARVPAGAAQPTFGRTVESDEALVVARAEGVDMLLPVAQQVTTAVAFHPVDSGDAVAFTPVGDRLGGGDLGQKLADIFAGGGGVQYYLMDGDGGEESPSTAGLDIGAVPGSSGHLARRRQGDGHQGVRHPRPLQGHRDRHPAGRRPVAAAHRHSYRQAQGRDRDVVQRGTTTLGSVRGFPAALDQALSQYTSDNGDHVQLVLHWRRADAEERPPQLGLRAAAEPP